MKACIAIDADGEYRPRCAPALPGFTRSFQKLANRTRVVHVSRRSPVACPPESMLTCVGLGAVYHARAGDILAALLGEMDGFVILSRGADTTFTFLRSSSTAMSARGDLLPRSPFVFHGLSHGADWRSNTDRVTPMRLVARVAEPCVESYARARRVRIVPGGRRLLQVLQRVAVCQLSETFRRTCR